MQIAISICKLIQIVKERAFIMHHKLSFKFKMIITFNVNHANEVMIIKMTFLDVSIISILEYVFLYILKNIMQRLDGCFVII